MASRKERLLRRVAAQDKEEEGNISSSGSGKTSPENVKPLDGSDYTIAEYQKTLAASKDVNPKAVNEPDVKLKTTGQDIKHTNGQNMQNGALINPPRAQIQDILSQAVNESRIFERTPPPAHQPEVSKKCQPFRQHNKGNNNRPPFQQAQSGTMTNSQPQYVQNPPLVPSGDQYYPQSYAETRNCSHSFFTKTQAVDDMSNLKPKPELNMTSYNRLNHHNDQINGSHVLSKTQRQKYIDSQYRNTSLPSNQQNTMTATPQSMEVLKINPSIQSQPTSYNNSVVPYPVRTMAKNMGQNVYVHSIDQPRRQTTIDGQKIDLVQPKTLSQEEFLIQPELLVQTELKKSLERKKRRSQTPEKDRGSEVACEQPQKRQNEKILYNPIAQANILKTRPGEVAIFNTSVPPQQPANRLTVRPPEKAMHGNISPSQLQPANMMQNYSSNPDLAKQQNYLLLKRHPTPYNFHMQMQNRGNVPFRHNFDPSNKEGINQGQNMLQNAQYGQPGMFFYNQALNQHQFYPQPVSSVSEQPQTLMQRGGPTYMGTPPISSREQGMPQKPFQQFNTIPFQPRIAPKGLGRFPFHNLCFPEEPIGSCNIRQILQRPTRAARLQKTGLEGTLLEGLEPIDSELKPGNVNKTSIKKKPGAFLSTSGSQIGTRGHVSKSLGLNSPFLTQAQAATVSTICTGSHSYTSPIVTSRPSKHHEDTLTAAKILADLKNTASGTPSSSKLHKHKNLPMGSSSCELVTQSQNKVTISSQSPVTHVTTTNTVVTASTNIKVNATVAKSMVFNTAATDVVATSTAATDVMATSTDATYVMATSTDATDVMATSTAPTDVMATSTCVMATSTAASDVMSTSAVDIVTNTVTPYGSTLQKESEDDMSENQTSATHSGCTKVYNINIPVTSVPQIIDLDIVTSIGNHLMQGVTDKEAVVIGECITTSPEAEAVKQGEDGNCQRLSNPRIKEGQEVGDIQIEATQNAPLNVVPKDSPSVPVTVSECATQETQYHSQQPFMKYLCMYCEFSTNNMPVIEAHLKETHAEAIKEDELKDQERTTPLYCDNCPYFTYKKIVLAGHMRLVHGFEEMEKRKIAYKEIAYKCNVCAKHNTDFRIMEKHVRSIHCMNTLRSVFLQCEKCPRKMNTGRSFTRHVRKNHTPKFKVLDCIDFQPNHLQLLYENCLATIAVQKTTKIKAGNQFYYCKECRYTGKCLAVKKHIITKHWRQVNAIPGICFVCEKCGESMNSSMKFKRHGKKSHSRKSPHMLLSQKIKDVLIDKFMVLNNGQKIIYGCKECQNIQSAYLGIVQKHILGHHISPDLDTQRNTCQFCGLLLDDLSLLSKHLSTKHPVKVNLLPEDSLKWSTIVESYADVLETYVTVLSKVKEYVNSSTKEAQSDSDNIKTTLKEMVISKPKAVDDSTDKSNTNKLSNQTEQVVSKSKYLDGNTDDSNNNLQANQEEQVVQQKSKIIDCCPNESNALQNNENQSHAPLSQPSMFENLELLSTLSIVVSNEERTVKRWRNQITRDIKSKYFGYKPLSPRSRSPRQKSSFPWHRPISPRCPPGRVAKAQKRKQNETDKDQMVIDLYSFLDSSSDSITAANKSSSHLSDNGIADERQHMEPQHSEHSHCEADEITTRNKNKGLGDANKSKQGKIDMKKKGLVLLSVASKFIDGEASFSEAESTNNQNDSHDSEMENQVSDIIKNLACQDDLEKEQEPTLPNYPKSSYIKESDSKQKVSEDKSKKPNSHSSIKPLQDKNQITAVQKKMFPKKRNTVPQYHCKKCAITCKSEKNLKIHNSIMHKRNRRITRFWSPFNSMPSKTKSKKVTPSAKVKQGTPSIPGVNRSPTSFQDTLRGITKGNPSPIKRFRPSLDRMPCRKINITKSTCLVTETPSKKSLQKNDVVSDYKSVHIDKADKKTEKDIEEPPKLDDFSSISAQMNSDSRSEQITKDTSLSQGLDEKRGNVDLGVKDNQKQKDHNVKDFRRNSIQGKKENVHKPKRRQLGSSQQSKARRLSTKNEVVYHCLQCSFSDTERTIVRHHCTQVHMNPSTKIGVMKLQAGYKCYLCKYQSISREPDNIKRHIKTIHLILKPYNCGLCEKNSATLEGVKQHNKKTHMGEQCQIVTDQEKVNLSDYFTEQFYTEDSFMGNQPKEPVSLKLRSNLANKFGQFLDKSSVDFATHEEKIETLECIICGVTHLNDEDMMEHVGKHIHITPYTCSICDRSFLSYRDAEKHCLTHTNNEPGLAAVVQTNENLVEQREVLSRNAYVSSLMPEVQINARRRSCKRAGLELARIARNKTQEKRQEKRDGQLCDVALQTNSSWDDNFLKQLKEDKYFKIFQHQPIVLLKNLGNSVDFNSFYKMSGQVSHPKESKKNTSEENDKSIQQEVIIDHQKKQKANSQPMTDICHIKKVASHETNKKFDDTNAKHPDSPSVKGELEEDCVVSIADDSNDDSEVKNINHIVSDKEDIAKEIEEDMFEEESNSDEKKEEIEKLVLLAIEEAGKDDNETIEIDSNAGDLNVPKVKKDKPEVICNPQIQNDNEQDQYGDIEMINDNDELEASIKTKQSVSPKHCINDDSMADKERPVVSDEQEASIIDNESSLVESETQWILCETTGRLITADQDRGPKAVMDSKDKGNVKETSDHIAEVENADKLDVQEEQNKEENRDVNSDDIVVEVDQGLNRIDTTVAMPEEKNQIIEIVVDPIAELPDNQTNPVSSDVINKVMDDIINGVINNISSEVKTSGIKHNSDPFDSNITEVKHNDSETKRNSIMATDLNKANENPRLSCDAVERDCQQDEYIVNKENIIGEKEDYRISSISMVSDQDSNAFKSPKDSYLEKTVSEGQGPKDVNGDISQIVKSDMDSEENVPKVDSKVEVLVDDANKSDRMSEQSVPPSCPAEDETCKDKDTEREVVSEPVPNITSNEKSDIMNLDATKESQNMTLNEESNPSKDSESVPYLSQEYNTEQVPCDVAESFTTEMKEQTTLTPPDDEEEFFCKYDIFEFTNENNSQHETTSSDEKEEVLGKNDSPVFFNMKNGPIRTYSRKKSKEIIDTDKESKLPGGTSSKDSQNKGVWEEKNPIRTYHRRGFKYCEVRNKDNMLLFNAGEESKTLTFCEKELKTTTTIYSTTNTDEKQESKMVDSETKLTKASDKYPLGETINPYTFHDDVMNEESKKAKINTTSKWQQVNEKPFVFGKDAKQTESSSDFRSKGDDKSHTISTGEDKLSKDKIADGPWQTVLENKKNTEDSKSIRKIDDSLSKEKKKDSESRHKTEDPKYERKSKVGNSQPKKKTDDSQARSKNDESKTEDFQSNKKQEDTKSKRKMDGFQSETEILKKKSKSSLNDQKVITPLRTEQTKQTKCPTKSGNRPLKLNFDMKKLKKTLTPVTKNKELIESKQSCHEISQSNQKSENKKTRSYPAGLLKSNPDKGPNNRTAWDMFMPTEHPQKPERSCWDLLNEIVKNANGSKDEAKIQTEKDNLSKSQKPDLKSVQKIHSSDKKKAENNGVHKSNGFHTSSELSSNDPPKLTLSNGIHQTQVQKEVLLNGRGLNGHHDPSKTRKRSPVSSMIDLTGDISEDEVEYAKKIRKSPARGLPIINCLLTPEHSEDGSPELRLFLSDQSDDEDFIVAKINPKDAKLNAKPVVRLSDIKLKCAVVDKETDSFM